MRAARGARGERGVRAARVLALQLASLSPSAARAERAEAESELAFAKAESRLGAHDEAIAAAKAEVDRLSKVAERL